MEQPDDGIIIEQVRPETTWQLRRDVLYPGMMKHEMELAEDPDGIHFGAYRDDKLAGVVSLFQQERSFQFRKLAVDAAVQHQGVGSALMNFIISYAATNGGHLLWCNARTNATVFYLKFGFTHSGRLFSRNNIGYEIMEKPLTPVSDR
ncbi:MAG TPA: GNAT family N-acetyltransferase [Mucilaginibacter sp.]|nr:GNAT family N-acetyltransferase [Mucilaginibacter sp.]